MKTATNTKQNELTDEQIKNLKPGQICKRIITKLIKKENINWSRDMACAKRLYQLIPDNLFWSKMESDTQFDACPQLLTEASINFLKKKYALFKLEFDDKNRYNTLTVEKVGADLNLVKSKQSVMDFLNPS